MQSQMSTIGAFVFGLFMLIVFEPIFHLRGIFRFMGAGVIAWLFYNYWEGLLLKIQAILLIFGLEPL